MSKVRNLILILIILSLAIAEFPGNLLKMSVLPCCPHIPASSVSAMLNEINFRGGALKFRTDQTANLSVNKMTKHLNALEIVKLRANSEKSKVKTRP